MKKTITIIDTFGFLFRSYYALPPLRASSGFPTGLLTGFMNFIAGIGKDFKTDYIVFALDSKGDTFRKELYDNYKAQRPDVPEDLLSQLPIAISWVEKMGFKIAIKTGYEADDMVASIATDAVLKDLEVRIVSHDKDLYQLIDDKNSVYLFDPTKKQVIDEAKCLEKYGVMPSEFIDYQALVGDTADNIPGVKGVGAKTAEALIKEFKNIENIYENIEKVDKPRVQNLLLESKENAFLSKELVTLKTDCHFIDNLEEFTLPEQNPILKIEDELLGLDMQGILQRVSRNGLNYKTTIPQKNENENKIEYILLNDETALSLVINKIPRDSIVAFDTETTNLDTHKAKIVGFSFAFEENKAYYVPISHNYLGVDKQISMETAKKTIEILNRYKLVLQNFKYDWQIIKNNFDIDLKLYADTMILSWVLDTDSKVGIDYQIKKYFKIDMLPYSQVVKKGEDFSSVELEKATQYAAEDALMTLKLFNKQLEIFKEKGEEELLNIAFELEFNFIYVLASMEQRGIKVDISLLQEYQKKSQIFLNELKEKIFESVGFEFNIRSPKQVGEVLFEKLNLPPSKKTKTGYSTDESVLNSLFDLHKVVPLLLDFREADKMHSTYIEPLLDLGLKDSENRIFTSFLQTGTTTGRLSSKSPNLQNIPTFSANEIDIRKAFIAKDGYKLVGVDYSQIELRLLAHFSQDEALVEAFRNNLDIHLQTAIKIFGEEEGKKRRAVAKSINFGLLYGMGAKKLGDTLKISSKEAKVYIDSYFEAFKSVKDYLKSIEDRAIEQGFVKTLLNRKRFFDFQGATPLLRAAYLREAVNTQFQGSAADLIKLAMIKIEQKYKNSEDIKMLLQIHDELIFEVEDEKIEHFTKEIKEIMENIFVLNVPLKVSINVGKSWQELK